MREACWPADSNVFILKKRLRSLFDINFAQITTTLSVFFFQVRNGKNCVFVQDIYYGTRRGEWVTGLSEIVYSARDNNSSHGCDIFSKNKLSVFAPVLAPFPPLFMVTLFSSINPASVSHFLFNNSCLCALLLWKIRHVPQTFSFNFHVGYQILENTQVLSRVKHVSS